MASKSFSVAWRFYAKNDLKNDFSSGFTTIKTCGVDRRDPDVSALHARPLNFFNPKRRRHSSQTDQLGLQSPN